MSKNFLVVAESFYSLQGEGRTMGIPAVFIRLTACNILCQSDSWVCDTIAVWKKGTKTLFEDIITDEYLFALRNGAHMVLTGGEPLLHQKKIIEFLKWFEETYEFMPVIEFETNGTLCPDAYLQQIVDFWNVSPKLANSGETFEKRFKPDVIKVFNSLKTSIFKFVIEKEEDFVDLTKTYMTLVDDSKIYLMPAGENQEQLNQTRDCVVNLCRTHCLRYTERLHIVIWNKKTGV